MAKDKIQEVLDLYKNSRITSVMRRNYFGMRGNYFFVGDTGRIGITIGGNIAPYIKGRVIFAYEIDQNYPEIVKIRKQLKFLNNL